MKKIQIIFIQMILHSLRFLLKLRSKASKNFKNSNMSKLYQIQAPIPQRTFTTNLQRSRIFKEPTKKMKNMKNKESLTSAHSMIHCSFVPKTFQSTFQSKWICLNQDYINTILSKTFASRSNQRIILL